MANYYSSSSKKEFAEGPISRKIAPIAVFSLFFMMLAFACSKEHSNDQGQLLGPGNIASVKQLISSAEELYPQKAIWLNSLANGLDFKNADMSDFGFGKTLITIPISISVERDIAVKGLSVPNSNTRSFLLLYKNNDGSFQLGNIVQLTPDGNSPLGNRSSLITNFLHSNNGSTNFSGYFTSVGLDEGVNSEMKFDQGVRISYGKKGPLESDSSRTTPATSNCTDYYWVVTETDQDGNIISQTWSYIGSSCAGLQQGGGGGGGATGETTNACEDAAESNFQSELADDAPVFIDGTPTESVISSTQKYKNPKWQCFKGWGGWWLWSQETGITQLINAQNNVWSWQSFSHVGMSMTGSTAPGVGVTYTQGFGTPSFTPGSYTTMYYAGMSVDYQVTFSYLPKCPIINQTIPSVTKSFVSTAIWTAIP